MNTKQIEYILELAKTMNFNQAAENMYIAQSTMTYQIKSVEEEIGFKIFERSGKGATLTPAGFQFCITLRNIQNELHDAIEQGQNFSRNYKEDISIGVPLRSAIHKLPECIIQFTKLHPDISITPKFASESRIDSFLNGQLDIMFALEDDVRRLSDITIHPLYRCGFYLITKEDDPLAQKDVIHIEDLTDRTLMIGGPSPAKLKYLQQKIIHDVHVQYFNSQSHDTTLINVASNKGVCIAPGFLNDHTGEFAWTPVDYNDDFSCVLCTHENDQRESVKDFIRILQNAYK